MWVAFASYFFFSTNITLYAIFNDQSFNDTLTNDIVSFEQLGLGARIDFSEKLQLRHIFDTAGTHRKLNPSTYVPLCPPLSAGAGVSNDLCIKTVIHRKVKVHVFFIPEVILWVITPIEQLFNSDSLWAQ